MKSITLIIFLTIYKTSYGLSCVITDDGKPLERSLAGFDFADFMEDIQNLSSMDFDGHSPCRVEFSINYNEQLLIVKFTEHLVTSTLEDQHVQIDVLVDGNSVEEIDVYPLLHYACLDDECEKNFTKKYVDWFVKTGYGALKEKLNPLIFGNGEKLRE
jgi:hypothetical protein